MKTFVSTVAFIMQLAGILLVALNVVTILMEMSQQIMGAALGIFVIYLMKGVLAEGKESK